MTVYVVKTLVCSEYGNYDIYEIFDSLEKAQNKINELGNNKISVWFDDNYSFDQYIIEEYEVY